MKKLVALGCSNTYGDGLPDAGSFPDGISKLAWPNVLAKQLNVECENLGVPGNSNIQILRKLIEYPFTGNEVVAILWTYFNREHRFNKDGSSFPLHSFNSKEYKEWILTYDHYHFSWKSWLHVHHADLILTSKNILHVHWVPDMYDFGKPKELDVNNLIYDNISFVDYALDGAHPGIQTHKNIAERFYKRLTNVLH